MSSLRKAVLILGGVVTLIAAVIVPPLVLLVGLFGEANHLCADGRVPGGAAGSSYTGSGAAGLNATQTQYAADVHAQGKQMGIPDQGVVVALAVVSQESGFKVYANDGQGGDLAADQRGIERSLDLPHDAVGTDHGSLGLFQQQWPWWGSMAELMDPAVSARLFYEALLEIEGWEDLPVTVAAQRVQRSAYPDAYADDEDLARQLLAGLQDAASSGDTVPVGDDGNGPANGTGEDPYDLGNVTLALRALVELLGPQFGIDTVGGYRDSATDMNGHPAGLAADFMVPLTPAGQDQGQKLATYAQRNAPSLGIDYIIWNQEIWSAARAREGWRPMEDRGDPTQNHVDHVHINVLPDATPSDVTGSGTGTPTIPTGGSAAGSVAGLDCEEILGDAAAAAGGALGEGGVTFATLNLLGAGHTAGPGARRGFPGWEQRLPRAMDKLKSSGVSIAALQEVHSAQAGALTTRRYTREWGVHPQGGRLQDRVVWDRTQWVATKRRVIELPYFGGSMTPMPLVRLQSTATGEAVWVWSVHLPADVAGDALRHRTRGLRLAAQTVRGLAGRDEKVVLAGDFNDAGDGGKASHCQLTPLMRNAFGGGARPCAKPRRAAPVDHIYGANISWSGAQVDNSTKAEKISDHPLVIATTQAAGGVVHPMPPNAQFVDRRNYGNSGSNWTTYHTGTDFSASCGTPVRAATAGRVRIRTDQSWSGPWLLMIETGQGQLATWYAHMSTVDVEDGDQVRPGQRIGTVGTEGNSTGCHLHFEVHPKGGGYAEDDVDPTPWLEQNTGERAAGSV